MRTTTTQLLPLFPYLGPGAMLPAGALFRGRPGAEYGRFFHRNSEEEVNVCFGAQQALGAAGVMFIGGKMHEVQAPLLDTNDPNAFLVAVITQRQQDEGREQRESVIFRCSECNNKLHQVDYSAELPDPERPDLVTGGRVDDEYDMFPTMWGSILATDSFNSDENARTCTRCGHVNPPFPAEAVGLAELRRPPRSHQRGASPARRDREQGRSGHQPSDAERRLAEVADLNQVAAVTKLFRSSLEHELAVVQARTRGRRSPTTGAHAARRSTARCLCR